MRERGWQPYWGVRRQSRQLRRTQPAAVLAPRSWPQPAAAALQSWGVVAPGGTAPQNPVHGRLAHASPCAQINDISLEDYIAVKPKYAVYGTRRERRR